jgi:hypothetical protein
MMMQRMCLSDLMGDFVTYRNLEPADSRLCGLSAIYSELGLPAGRIPRKTEPDFAATIMHLLHQAQPLRGVSRPLERLLYIGDTRMNDGTAAANLGQHLPLCAFIGEDRLGEPEKVEAHDGLTLVNRWTALDDFLRTVRKEGFALDDGTALLLDLDKTAIGARGRNDQPIDQARVDAARDTVRATLGQDFDMRVFRPIYDELHKPSYHHLTRDNQDYLVYISLMVSAGVYDWDALQADLRTKRLARFEEFVALCEERVCAGDFAVLCPIHREVAGNMRRGDPTPFKSFRYREYEATVARMDALPDDTPPERLLAEEITITREVAEAALELRERGVLVFGLSDKPDEASVPTPELARKGYLPLHRVTMKVTGSRLCD